MIDNYRPKEKKSVQRIPTLEHLALLPYYRVFRRDFARFKMFYLANLWNVFQYYEMSYGLNVEMHKQVSTLFFFLNVTIHLKHPSVERRLSI